MTVVFMGGSLSIVRLPQQIQEHIRGLVAAGVSMIVGDARGADTAIQRVLSACGAERVTVFCAGVNPRNNVAGWEVQRIITDESPGTRAFFTAKDIEMARICDSGLMIWDGKSKGTLNNARELIRRGKRLDVFVDGMLVPVGDLAELRALQRRVIAPCPATP